MDQSEIEVAVENENLQPEDKDTQSLIEGGGNKGWSKFTSLNGTSRAFTISVLTTVALGITTLYFDREFLEHEDGAVLDRATPGQALSAAARQIIRALMLLFICLLIAVIAFGLMGVNVYPFKVGDETRQRIWMIVAFVCAMFCSTLGIIVIVDTEIKFQQREDETETFQSAPAHYFLVTCFGLSLAWMDYLFVSVVFVGKYLELQQRESGWSIARKNLPRILSLARKDPTEISPIPKTLSFRQKVTSWCWNSFTALLKMIVDGVYNAVLALQHCLGVKTSTEEEGISENKWKSFSINFSNVFIDTSNALRSSWIVQGLHRLVTFICWDLWRPLRTSMNNVRDLNDSDRWHLRGSAQLIQMFDAIVSSLKSIRFSFRAEIDDMYHAIREDEEFEHSGWVLAAVLTSLVLLIYFGVGAAMNFSAYLNKVYIERRNCAVRTFEDNGDLGNLVLRIAGFNEASDLSETASRTGASTLQETACSADFSSDRPLNLPADFTLGPESSADDLLAVMNATTDPLYTDLADSTSRFQSNTSDDRMFSCPLDGFSISPCYSLSVINLLEASLTRDLNETRTPTDVFHDHAIGKTVYVVDSMLRHVRYTIWPGWMVGLVVGIYSLLSVLGQYKRLSLAIRSGLFTDLKIPHRLKVSGNREANIRRAKSVITDNHWGSLIERYPMGFSVFFFGILVSTAVIQLFVFGSVISLLLAFLVSIFDERVFSILRPFLAMLIAFLITWAINGPIAQRVISEGILVKKYHIFHEFTFLMFLLVYTALHLVLGVFIALFRLFWVLITTLASLNRLDKNLFPLLKGNDLGHKSFMSMILMHHAFQSNACATEALARQVIDAMKDTSPSSDDEESEKKDTTTPSKTHDPESKTKTVTFASSEAQTSYDDLPHLPIV